MLGRHPDPMSARPKRKRPQKTVEAPSTTQNDVIALGLIVFAIIHFLALITYTPSDLPAAVSFSALSTPNSPAHNVIGPLGAFLAGYSIFIFGAAAYLIPTGLFWFGGMKILSRRPVPFREIVALTVLVFAGSCLAHFQPWWFEDWEHRFNTLGPGGCVGAQLGQEFFVAFIGTGGSAILVGFAYASAAIVLTGIAPIDFLRASKHGIEALRESFEENRIARAESAAERAELEARREERALKQEAAAAKKARPKRKAPAKRKTATEFSQDDPFDATELDPAEAETAELELPLAEIPATPEPKIIDSSARRNDETTGLPKMTLADLRKKRAGDNPATGPGSATSLDDAFEDYDLPDLDLLDYDENAEAEPADTSELLALQNTIVRTLGTFGIPVTPGDITRGPTITRYEIYPGEGLRVNRITSLEADIARATKAERINIIAPIPGKDTVGIEIANDIKVAVPLRELFQDSAFTDTKSKLPIALGKDVYGNTIIADLAAMPHLLVAGATGSGKSVCINSIIASLLYQFTPDQLRFIMIDPKVVEMQIYNSLPHLVIPVVTDPKKVLLALRWVVNEMEHRYQVFAKEGVRNFDSFNKRERKQPEPKIDPATGEEIAPEPESTEVTIDLDAIADELSAPFDPAKAADELKKVAVKIEESTRDHAGWSDAEPGPTDEEMADDPDQMKIPDRYPYIVVIIDELADLMQTAPADVELAIARITQMARAAGIHLIVATQTPRADVITGVIKANIPSRIAFQVSSALDSRVILDTKGADKLVGKGDLLYLPPGTSKLLRAQGAYLSDDEISRIVKHCGDQADPVFEQTAKAAIEGGSNAEADDLSDEDLDCLEKCLEVIAQEKKASTSLLQRRLRLGYTRAARMMDILEAKGIIGPGEGAKPREILVDLNEIVV